MLSTDRKGAIAELAIARRALELDIDVYRPVFEGGRYDFVFGIGDRLLRVQCKWARKRGDVIAVPFSSARRTANGLKRKVYDATEIDAVAVCPDIGSCFLLPYDRFEGPRQVLLRLGPSLNNQRVGVNWADDYALESLHFSEAQGP